MPDVTAKIEFLAKRPLYESEKPFLLLPSKEQNLDPDEIRLNNLEFESHDGLIVKDMRMQKDLSIDSCGFEFHSQPSVISNFDQSNDIEVYREETQQMLAERFGAERVVTYEVRLRKNLDFNRKEFDVYDKLLVEGPAKGAHNGGLANRSLETAHVADVTYTSGPKIIQRYLTKEDQNRYLKPGNRIRIFK